MLNLDSNMVKTFSDFINEKKDHSDSSGIAILFDNKILLVHPTNGSWMKPMLGIPKGRLDGDENLMEAAIRETFEEIGIKLSLEQLNPMVETIEIFNNGNYIRSIHYFICKIKTLSEIGLESFVIPRDQLQLEEVDWAGFINIKDAYSKMSRNQLILLDRIS